MIEFFRDTLDGKVYSITVAVCIFIILACIGYLVTQKLEEEKKKLLAAQAQTPPNVEQ